MRERECVRERQRGIDDNDDTRATDQRERERERERMMTTIRAQPIALA